MYDYQGRSYLHVPQDVGVNLRSTMPPEKCYLPKKQIHVWSGHTKVGSFGVYLIKMHFVLYLNFYKTEAAVKEMNVFSRLWHCAHSWQHFTPTWGVHTVRYDYLWYLYILLHEHSDFPTSFERMNILHSPLWNLGLFTKLPCE